VEVTQHAPGVPIILVGTKLDLRDDSSTIERLAKTKEAPTSESEGQKLAKEIKAAAYCECSGL